MTSSYVNKHVSCINPLIFEVRLSQKLLGRPTYRRITGPVVFRIYFLFKVLIQQVQLVYVP